MSKKNIRNLQGLYESVEDIDLYTGLTQETPEADDGMVSRTFRCLIHDQFARLKKGDRYFYDLEGQGGSFKINQVQFQIDLLWGLQNISTYLFYSWTRSARFQCPASSVTILIKLGSCSPLHSES